MHKEITPLMLAVGNNIRKQREIQDIKQEDLASAIDISIVTLSKIENTGDVGLCQIEKICAYLKIDISRILPSNNNTFNFNDSPNSSGNYHNYANEQLIQILSKDLEQKNIQILELIKNANQ
jgi:transcriptional regulator with XRE-family HTH domain